MAAVEAVEQKMQSHVIEIEMDRKKGRLVYEIDVVLDASASHVVLDARSGEIISSKKPWLENTWHDIWDSDRHDLLGNISPLSEILKNIEKNSTGRVVTRSMLLENVWDYHFDPQTNVIDQHVSRLRQKIDKDYSVPLIETVRGTGYKIRKP